MAVDIDNGDDNLVTLMTGRVHPGKDLLFHLWFINILEYHIDLLVLKFPQTFLGPTATGLAIYYHIGHFVQRFEGGAFVGIKMLISVVTGTNESNIITSFFTFMILLP
jgi:hypothetical protein